MNNLMLNFHCICHRYKFLLVAILEMKLNTLKRLKEFWLKCGNFLNILQNIWTVSLRFKLSFIISLWQDKLRKLLPRKWERFVEPVGCHWNKLFKVFTKATLPCFIPFKSFKQMPLPLGYIRKSRHRSFWVIFLFLKRCFRICLLWAKPFRLELWISLGSSLQFNSHSLACKTLKQACPQSKNSKQNWMQVENWNLSKLLLASDRRGLETLLGRYIESLKSNIQIRFEDCLGIP